MNANTYYTYTHNSGEHDWGTNFAKLIPPLPQQWLYLHGIVQRVSGQALVWPGTFWYCSIWIYICTIFKTKAFLKGKSKLTPFLLRKVFGEDNGFWDDIVIAANPSRKYHNHDTNAKLFSSGFVVNIYNKSYHPY